MSKISVLNVKGEKVKDIKLNDETFGVLNQMMQFYMMLYV